MFFELITDGACIGNPGPGGWAFLLLKDGDIVEEQSGHERDTTNNRMELSAVIRGLGYLGSTYPSAKQVRVVSDSKYVLDAFRQNWIVGWKKRGWKTSDNKPVKNQDLWVELIHLAGRFTVDWQWVKGHSGDPHNERVDSLAREAAESLGRVL